MSRGLFIDRDGQIRRLDESQFPLSIGGSDADIPLPGAAGAAPAAWLGLSSGELFVQASDGAASCNGSPISASQWLRHGDVVRVGAGRIRVELDDDRLTLIVDTGDGEETTAPPQLIRAETVTIAPPSDDGATIAPVEFRPARATARATRSARRLRPLTVVVWLFVLLLAGVAWTLFTVRPVELTVTPEPDRLFVEGALVDWKVGGRHVLRTGSYTLVAEKDGYRRLEQPIEITREASQSFRFTLDKLPGFLVVDTGGVAGAEVFVDGVSRGVTPLDPLELELGDYAIGVRAERYEAFEAPVTIEGEGRTQTLEVLLVPRWASVTIDSAPAGATVRVDGGPVGRTPLVTELLEGRHRIEWSLPGYESQSRGIQVEANTPLTVPRVTLDPLDARLVVASTPSDATITVDGVFRGQTPAEFYVEPGEAHEVTLSKVGHETASRTVNLASGETSTLSFELAARTGRVEVAAWPPDAELLLDGRSLGRADSQVLELTAVPHEIEIRKEGYEPYSARVTPRPGLPQALRVTLKTPEQIFEETTPRVIRTVQGQEMRLIEGGRFMMGAPRREPGRRSNEVEREVEITRPFYVATMEVSNRQFREFVGAHLSGRVGDFSLEMDHHPVVRVSWDEAAAYCNWLSKQDGLEMAYVKSGSRMVPVKPMTNGYRLPTEAEWAWVARYPDGDQEWKYPWGQALPIEPDSGNYADFSSLAVLATVLTDYEDDYPVTAPVDAFRPNALGLFNLGGNVSEWVHDFYAINPDAEGLDTDPTGPADGDHHVIRGSSWMDATVSELRLTYRDYGSEGRPDVGFRIARWVSAPTPAVPVASRDSAAAEPTEE